MLIRAYRISDRLGVVLEKSLAGITEFLLLNLRLFAETIRYSLGSVGSLLFAVFSVIAAVILWIARNILRLLTASSGVVLRTGGKTATAARSSASQTQARRSARAEIEIGLAEDPLRRQNRILSGVVVIVLLGLIGVVLWATSQKEESPFVAAPGNLSAIGEPDNAANLNNPESGSSAIATPVPTATSLPDVLQVRGSIAYVMREQGQTDLWAAPVDSRTRLRLTNSTEDERDPAWSPDGSRLAYASNQDGNWELYIYDLNTNLPPSRMTFGLGFEGGPDWSPDGTFLVYESYQQNSHLDIFVMQADGTETPVRIASSDAPDFSPIWSPSPGRRIAFTSWRDGNQDIYIFNLDTQEIINLTNTPNREEDFAAWSPDGELIAYSAVEGGIETVFVKSANDPNAGAEAFSRGRTPSWSPDGNSIVYAVDTDTDTRIIVSPYREGGVTTQVIQAELGASSPVWTSTPLPTTLVNTGGLELGVTEPLFVEQVDESTGDSPYQLAPLFNISGIDQAVLSDRVNDSFNALRVRTNDVVGSDFLGLLSDAYMTLETRPLQGEPVQNWHKSGRAFSFNRNQIRGVPPPIEIVREDTDLATYWRVYVRVAEEAQTGELGEPLRRMPWDFLSAGRGDVESFEQGGRLRSEMPTGYYVDLTQLAEDYGWLRVPASSDWRNNVNGLNYWTFQKREGLSWYQAMREIYTEGALINFAPTPTPLPLVPTPEATTDGS